MSSARAADTMQTEKANAIKADFNFIFFSTYHDSIENIVGPMIENGQDFKKIDRKIELPAGNFVYRVERIIAIDQRK